MTYIFYQPHLKVELKISAELLTKTFEIVWQHFPEEFGGIFLGSIDTENSCATISDIVTPDTYDISKSSFKRYSKSLNKIIEKAYSKSDGEIIYLGEWHSHPLHLPLPSKTDHDSMVNLSNQRTIKLKTPILLIISYNACEVFSPRFYIMHEKRFYSYYQK